MIAEVFTDEPIDLGSVEVDGSVKKIVVDIIPLGVLCRIVSQIAKNWVNLEGKNGDIDSILSAVESVLTTAPLVIAALLSTKVKPVDKSIAVAISEQWTPYMLLNALSVVFERISIDKLFDYYKFENKGGQVTCPGQGSPWASVINLAIASKGWSEDALKWDMSFTNLIMYGMCIPSMGGDSKNNHDSREEVDMFDFFDNRG